LLRCLILGYTITVLSTNAMFSRWNAFHCETIVWATTVSKLLQTDRLVCIDAYVDPMSTA